MITKKGVVTAVDIERSSCRVLTENMQFLSDVTWKGTSGGTSGYGDSNTPQEMDQVYMTQIGNKWVIDGFIQAQYAGGLKRPGVSKASGGRIELMDLTTLKPRSIKTNPAIPTDSRVGDRIFTTEGGGRLGVLRAGTIIAKSSPLSQLILSPFNDSARLVSRNFEHFTDLDSTYKISSRGQLYSLHEVFRTTADSRSQRPSFTEYFGNVGVGESLGRNPIAKNKGAHGTAVSGAGADKGIVRKTSTYDAGNELTSFEEEYISGRLHRFVQKGGSKTEYDQTLDKVSVKVHGGDTSFYSMNESSIHLDVGSTVKIDITKSGIVLNSNGNAVVTINASGAMSISCKDMNVNSQAVNWSASSVTWNVGGAFTVNASSINLG